MTLCVRRVCYCSVPFQAVLALASATPVVTPQYLREMVVCVQSRVAPDISPTDFEPALDEPTLVGSGCTIGVSMRGEVVYRAVRSVLDRQQLHHMG